MACHGPLGAPANNAGCSLSKRKPAPLDPQTQKSPSYCFHSGRGVKLATSYFRATYRSTIIGAAAFHFRVRNGNGWGHCARITRSLTNLKPQAEPCGGELLKSFRFSSCPGGRFKGLKFARLLPTHCVGFWLRTALRAARDQRRLSVALLTSLSYSKIIHGGNAFDVKLPRVL